MKNTIYGIFYGIFSIFFGVGFILLNKLAARRTIDFWPQFKQEHKQLLRKSYIIVGIIFIIFGVLALTRLVIFWP
jgi:uncharacterized membrane protein HdeD (DUF308 family)